MALAGFSLTASEVGLFAAFIAAFIGVYAARLQRLAAREGRQWERRADAYVEILTMCRHMGAYVWSLYPVYTRGTGEPMMDVSPDADQAKAAALVAAFASTEVLNLFKAWSVIVNKALLDRDTIHSNSDEGPMQDERRSAQKNLNDVLQPAELAARTALEDRIAAELGSRLR